METDEYEYETRSIDGFLSQLVRYVRAGHYFYVRCLVPEKKDPRVVAEKLLTRYDIRRKRWQRKRRNLKDAASIHLLLHEHLFVIILTKRRHDAFYADHGKDKLDIRRHSLKAFGYSVLYSETGINKQWKVSIRLDAETRRELEAHMLTVAVWDSYRDKNRMEREFTRLPYQSYGPVYEQLLRILQKVNRVRRRRGFQQIDAACIRKYRRLRKVFVERELAERAA